MDQERLVGKLVRPALQALDYDLVRVQLSTQGDLRLQIMAERSDRSEMTVEDCATISRNISTLLDAEDPISEAYTLEVSSPGIDRPLVRLDDYERFAGLEARIECRSSVLNRKNFSGILKGLVFSFLTALFIKDLKIGIAVFAPVSNFPNVLGSS